VPLTKSFRKFLGLRGKTTNGSKGSKSAPSFALGTIGQISSNGNRSKNISESEGDSVEDLIVDQRGIQVTRGFSTNAVEVAHPGAPHHVGGGQDAELGLASPAASVAKKEQYHVSVRQYPSWRIDEEKY
jgi:hypothetical protein